jgi:drug/metabolite transporter (DMT)-like permease
MTSHSFPCSRSSNGTTNNGGCDAAAAAAAPSVLMRHRRHGGVVGGMEDPSYTASSTTTAALTAHTTHDRASSVVTSSSKSSTGIPVPAAVLLWYLLGVVSIASSKVLLTRYTVPPLVLTLQQLIVGMTLLRIMLEMQTITPNPSSLDGDGEKEKDRIRGGVRPVPIQLKDRYCNTSSSKTNIATSVAKCEAGIIKGTISSGSETPFSSSDENITLFSTLLGWIQSSRTHHIHNQLLLAAIYFALGFLLTNYGFMLGSAAFVETIKAAEPFTSASVAVMWGLEHLGIEEVTSLIGIAAGVTLSTLGHGKGTTISTTAHSSSLRLAHDHESMNHISSSSPSLMTTCFIVMASNLCFSFRGLHQKLFRATPQGHVLMVDDLNLQYRMQQIGALMLIGPALLENSTLIQDKVHHLFLGGSTAKAHAIQYVLLSLTNGIAFTSYNLASTYVLTKLSVVHHAALNCIRRVFAIVVTSVIFGLTITVLQLVGIGLAVAGFFSYIHFKMMKEMKNSRRKELRRKWVGFLNDEKRGKWNGKKSLSLLPLNNTAK